MRVYSESFEGRSEIPTTGIFKYSSNMDNHVPLKPVCPVINIGPGKFRRPGNKEELMK
jgi:hypothetical protein